MRVVGRARPGLVLLSCAALLVSACSSTVAGAAYPISGGPATQEVLNYGYGALPAGRGPYQPDVVVVAGGAGAVRSVSSDGLTWTIDAGEIPGPGCASGPFDQPRWPNGQLAQ